MSKQNISVVVIGLVVVGTAAIAAMNQSQRGRTPPPLSGTPPPSVTTVRPPTNTFTTSTTSKPPTKTPAASGYTLADVAKHNSQASCWSAINGNVYNLTSWVSQHPGGEEAILSICGKDGSAAFNDQHGGQEKQAQVLATFKIGSLAR